jgi:limonene-1,2-epoxide hydrolase
MNRPSSRTILDAVDIFDATTFASHFAPDGAITFGNGPAMVGREAVEAGAAHFFTTIQGIHHEIVREWTVGDDTIVELVVTYTRHDGGVVAVPVVSIWDHDEQDRIRTYRVFFDLTPVFAEPAA